MRLVKQIGQLGIVAVIAFVGSQAVAAVDGNPALTLIFGLATAVLAVVGYRWIVRLTERRPPSEAGWPGAARRIAAGSVLGLALFSAVIATIALLGGYRIAGWGSLGGLVGLIGFMAAAAVTEELLFRGVLFRIVEERTGSWIALALTGLLFGLSHLLNPHATLWGAIAIAIEAGGMLAATYAATRSLWLPIGLHFGWNLAEAAIFGTEVSGNGATTGLLNGVTSGPTVLTGGEFGPEASIFSVLAGAAVTVLFMIVAHRRGRLVPIRRRRVVADVNATLSR
ncbi:CPBP family intramembrane glutamic endopeptidase [Microlunatus soli]|uniref:CAAX prenyl protease 2/Lysostaphin resistance protein A-like domain-containing protein n=1 Tax=Microlunatus soli TaxID=630515 RepID=A0A1H2AEB9_9ACTN|nr:CPBP family intramembrane glutamic endopeptidase [Microlunatus soli]SDT44102.1 hypothetical protein SAMN04489812_5857 [Microlunatus soli]